MTKGNRNIFILFFILLPLFIFSQKVDSSYVYGVNNNAAKLNREGAYKKADLLLSNLISDIKDNNLEEKYLSVTLLLKAKIETNIGLYNKSNKSIRKALNFFLKAKDSFYIADALNAIGVNHYFLADYDSTKIYYEKSYDIKKKIAIAPYDMAISAYNLAILYEDLAKPEKALELYIEAEQNLLDSNSKKNFLSDVYVGIAHLYFYEYRDINEAEKYAEKAMDIGMKNYGEFNPNMTFVYTSYANILESKEKYKESIELLKKSLKIRETTFGINHKWTCESYYDIANAYELDEQYGKAEVFYKKAIDIGEKINAKLYLANAKTELAKLYSEQKINSIEAQKLLEESLETKTSIFGSKNEIVTENFRFLALNAKNQKDKHKFHFYLNKVFSSGNYFKDSLNKIIAPFEVLKSLELLGDWYQEEYEENADIESLNKQFDLIDQEVALIHHSQNNFTSDRSKIQFANNYRDIFEKGLNTCWILYEKTKDKKYLEKAFQLFETNRNTTLLEGLQDIKYKLYSDIPEEMLEKERQIKQDLAKINMDLYYEKTASNPDKEFLSELINERIVISTKLDSLHKVFREKYPKYASLKFKNKKIKISDIQKNMDHNMQLITYFLGEEDLYSFTIIKKEVIFLKSAVANKISDLVESLNDEIISLKSTESTSNQLYTVLMSEQLKPDKKKIVIIPDHVLNYIPFELLQNNDNESVINNFTVSYTGSARLFLELDNSFFQYKLPNYWVGFSPDYKDRNQLINTDEITSINDIVDGTTFIENASTIENFKKNNQNHHILHLAMHAEIDNENPMFNKLVFADGDLTSSEIYNLNNKANLAVLSACNTGFGKLEKGEGVMSMARAFHFSGVPSVVMSLWRVPDKETKKIMVSFYKFLNEGLDKDEALQMAKKEYLINTDDIILKHPFYWSGFVLNGNTKALPNKSNVLLYTVSGSFLLVFLVFGYRRFRKTAKFKVRSQKQIRN
ncbi:MAG: CHAT domain-containing tetratricopeptide repeat protein [Bacteroidota bacterium]